MNGTHVPRFARATLDTQPMAKGCSTARISQCCHPLSLAVAFPSPALAALPPSSPVLDGSATALPMVGLPPSATVCDPIFIV